MGSAGSRLLALARSRPAGWALRVACAHMSFAIPARRLRETRSLLAFYHPSPAYAVHILILPKRACRSLLDLSPEDGEFLRDLIATVQGLVSELGLERAGYRLVANGGANQEVGVLHFHLISGPALGEG